MSNGTSSTRLDLDFSLVSESEAPTGVEQADLEGLVGDVLAAEGASGAWEITVALVNDPRLQELHRDFMGIDEPTDIMTFPAADTLAAGGELAISVDHARTQAGAWGLSPADEIRFLVVHGLLHLLGWRDDEEAKRGQMLERQQQLLEGWKLKNPASDR